MKKHAALTCLEGFGPTESSEGIGKGGAPRFDKKSLRQETLPKWLAGWPGKQESERFPGEM